MIKLKYKPLRGHLVISSRYDIRELGGFEFHPGVDYAAPIGTPIYAVDDGTVVVTWDNPTGYGLYVIIDHGHYCSLYAHLREHVLTTNQSIKAGDVVGYVGMTGYTSGPHLHFEVRDCSYIDKNFWLKSNLKGRHVMCIDPEKLVVAAAVVPEVTSDVRYKKYSDRIYELRGNVEDLSVKIVNKSNRSIEEPNCVNGTFFWHINAKEKYSTSILYAEGKLYQAAANHLPYPQAVYIVYKDNTPDMKLIKNISELDLTKIRLVIGGVGIRNTLDSTFKYSPASEGFRDAYADVLRRSNKTFIGYNKRLNKQYLLVLKNVTMAEAISIISDNSTGEAFDFCLMVDGGGSPFLNNIDSMVVYGDGRIIHNIIGFNL